MNLTTLSFLALILLYALANICDRVFNIHSNKFYKMFHFAGGFFVYIFINSLISNKLVSLFGVILVGVVWEIYEWLFWKYVSKRKIDKPQKKDTTNDLFMDFWGGTSALILTSLL